MNAELEKYEKVDKLFESFKNDNDIKELSFAIDFAKNKREQKNKFNIFKILKLDNYEIRHSNFLAWLLNPIETHGFGDSFLNLFLNKALKDEIADTSDIVIETEYFTNENRRIDILIHSRKSDFVCVIENKYGSDEHDEQCQHYKRFIEECSIFKNYGTKCYIFLDIFEPSGELLRKSLCGYKYITYEDVYKILTKIIENLDDNSITTQTVNQYIDILKEKYTMLDEKTKNQCKEIYAKYNDIFNIMDEYKSELRNDVYLMMNDFLNKTSDLYESASNEGEKCGYNDNRAKECGIRYIPVNLYKGIKDIRANNITKCPVFFTLTYKTVLELNIYSISQKSNKNNYVWTCHLEKPVTIDVINLSNEEIIEKIVEESNKKYQTIKDIILSKIQD